GPPCPPGYDGPPECVAPPEYPGYVALGFGPARSLCPGSGKPGEAVEDRSPGKLASAENNGSKPPGCGAVDALGATTSGSLPWAGRSITAIGMASTTVTIRSTAPTPPNGPGQYH